MNIHAGLWKWRACVRVDLDRGAVGVGTGWPNGDVAQQTQTITSTTSSLVQPRTGCVLPTQHTHTEIQHQWNNKLQCKIQRHRKGSHTCDSTKNATATKCKHKHGQAKVCHHKLHPHAHLTTLSYIMDTQFQLAGGCGLFSDKHTSVLISAVMLTAVRLLVSAVIRLLLVGVVKWKW